MQNKNKHPIKHEKRHHKWLMASLKSPRSVLLMIVLLTAFGGGIYSIVNSHAANTLCNVGGRTCGTAVVRVLSNTGVPLDGASVQVRAYHVPAANSPQAAFNSLTSCDQGLNYAAGQGNGSYAWTNCYVWTVGGLFQYYQIEGVSLAGWHYAGGTWIGSQLTIHSGDTGADFGIIYMQHDAPATPNITGADSQQTQLTLHWDPASGAEVYTFTRTGWESLGWGSTTNNYYTFTGLACGTTYALSVNAVAGGTPSSTATRSFTTSACSSGGSGGSTAPSPPPSPPPSGGGSTIVKNTGSSSRTVARTPVTSTSPAVTASTDSQPPTAPAGLTAIEGDAGTISLIWTASTDDTAVTGYMIERSEDDGQTWTTLSDNTTDVSYSDDSTTFATKYSYRVSAKDAAGNASDYAITDITTSSFSANAYVDKDSKIESDDGVVTVTIPKGALDVDASCAINQTKDKSLSKSNVVLAGAYELVCKTADGTQINKFKKPLTFNISVNKQLVKDKPQLLMYSGSKWTNSKLKLDNQHSFNFTTESPKPFAVVASGGGLVWWKILLGLFLLVGAIYGIFSWWRKRQQLTSYYDNLNAEYAAPTPTMPVNMAAPVVGSDESVYPPINIGPPPTQQPAQPVVDQHIGHRTIFSPAIGGQQSGSQQPPPAVGGVNDPFNEAPANSQNPTEPRQ